ncbi:MAG: DGQHR domain-containing protein, partial [Candidatus Hydrogenedentes bacterium]|nr:DGQHR domain-containing protein [Candidatus Hydrogenedentota bacterium]
MKGPGELRLPSIEIKQGPSRVFYSFAVDGKLLPKFATVSRIHRNGKDLLAGYQRPEVLSHIAEIRSYLESSDPLLPNAIVIAFDHRVKFEPASGASTGYSQWGTLIVPLNADGQETNK